MLIKKDGTNVGDVRKLNQKYIIHLVYLEEFTDA